MKLHLVDGTFELFRAHFAKRPGHVDPSGRDVKGSVGLAFSLLALLQEPSEVVTHIAVAFDNPIRSFRNDMFAGYKTEEGLPPELLAQFDLAEEATAALGITVWSMDRYEADDALAAGAAQYAPGVDQVRIMTPDKDLGQAVRGRHVVQVDRMRSRVFDESVIRAMRGVAPTSIPDWLGLVGDTADGIPGIPGFGAKSAAAVLARYETIEAIPTYAHEWDVEVRGARRLATNLAERREAALLYKKLATLVTDVPLTGSLADLEWRGVPEKRFLSWCDSLGVTTLRDRPHRWA
jgi:5'-3' exonuclease